MIGVCRLHLAQELVVCPPELVPLMRASPGVRWARVYVVRWRR